MLKEKKKVVHPFLGREGELESFPSKYKTKSDRSVFDTTKRWKQDPIHEMLFLQSLS